MREAAHSAPRSATRRRVAEPDFAWERQELEVRSDLAAVHSSHHQIVRPFCALPFVAARGSYAVTTACCPTRARVRPFCGQQTLRRNCVWSRKKIIRRRNAPSPHPQPGRQPTSRTTHHQQHAAPSVHASRHAGSYPPFITTTTILHARTAPRS